MKIKGLKLLFLLSMVLVSIVIIQMIMYSFHVVSHQTLFLQLVKVCHNWIHIIAFSPINAVLQLFALSTAVIFINIVIKQNLLHKRFSNTTKIMGRDRLSKVLSKKSGLPKKDLRVIESNELIALTCGFLNPKIIISTELVNQLCEDELKAVLYHEYYHHIQRDPLKKLFINALTSALWYMPFLKWMEKQYHLLKELSADHYSISKMKNDLPLSSALLKLIQVGKEKNAPTFAVTFAGTSVNYRIQQLIKPEKPVQVKVPVGSGLFSFTIFLGMTMMFLFVCP
ncbi:M56 family metallopeptidase [Halobacillus faecis]